MNKAKVGLGLVLALLIVGSAAAVSFRGELRNTAQLRTWQMVIAPAESPESGTLIEALDEAGFVIDEAGNVTIPNMLRFGDPPIGPIGTDGDQVVWSQGTVRVAAGGAWIDEHPVENPTGAACAIINPYDAGRRSGTNTVASGVNGTVVATGFYYGDGTGTCQVISPTTNAWSCAMAPASPSGIRIRTFRQNGTASSVSRSVSWSAQMSNYPIGHYKCGIMRNPAESEADILAWKLASLDSTRQVEDQYFLFLVDPAGDWYGDDRFCQGSGCVPVYVGMDVAWFVWRVEE